MCWAGSGAGRYPRLSFVGDVYRFLATAEDTNGKYATWEAIVPPGGGPQPHIDHEMQLLI